ncbi:MAG: MBL fold metallo-hydrolase [Opitutaceae bacterium]|nr:MBL fold metallo-hydrolase [Opitutaceae bacterium]
MHIHCIPAGPLATNAYLITDSGRGEALLVDAPHGVWEDIEPILQRENCRLVALLITHGHWDHTGDAARIQNLGVPLYAHEADRLFIEHPEVMGMFTIPGITLEPARLVHPVAQGDHLHLLGMRIEVRHVPGHCPGNVLFYFAALDAAFVGDALFNGGIGRYDLPGGSLEMLERSIRTQIYTLPANTAVYPGHGPETTVGDEMASNPYVPA